MYIDCIFLWGGILKPMRLMRTTKPKGILTCPSQRHKKVPLPTSSRNYKNWKNKLRNRTTRQKKPTTNPPQKISKPSTKGSSKFKTKGFSNWRKRSQTIINRRKSIHWTLWKPWKGNKSYLTCGKRTLLINGWTSCRRCREEGKSLIFQTKNDHFLTYSWFLAKILFYFHSSYENKRDKCLVLHTLTKGFSLCSFLS